MRRLRDNLKTNLLVGLLLLVIMPSQAKDRLNDYLSKGQYEEGIAYYTKKVKRKRPKPQYTFALGFLHFIDGVENLMQGFYKYGLNSETGQQLSIPFLRLPVPPNPKPEKVTGDQVRRLLDEFYRKMALVDSVLGTISNKKFKTKVNLGYIRMDYDANGKIEQEEYFHVVYTFYNRNAQKFFKKEIPFPIQFDNGDAYWLRGYANLLMGLVDFFLTFDGSPIFEYGGHMFFKNADTPYQKLINSELENSRRNRDSQFLDIIAMIHAFRLKPIAPQRSQRARKHLLKVIELSKKTWKLIEAEKDNDLEWLPNAKQTSVTETKITQEMITGWHEFLEEATLILDGKKLIAHWRIEDKGINLKKFFNNPPVLDPIMIVHGAGIIPYLEKGTFTSKNTWRRLQTIFRGDFIGFAIWIN